MLSKIKFSRPADDGFCSLTFTYDTEFTKFLKNLAETEPLVRWNDRTKFWEVHDSVILPILIRARDCFEALDYSRLPQWIKDELLKEMRESTNRHLC